MKTALALLSLFLALENISWASPQQNRMKTCAAEYHTKNIEKSQYRAFMKTCLKTGKSTKAPLKTAKKPKTSTPPKATKQKHPKAIQTNATPKAAIPAKTAVPVTLPTPANPSFPQSTNLNRTQQALAMNLKGEAKQEFLKTCSTAN